MTAYRSPYQTEVCCSPVTRNGVRPAGARFAPFIPGSLAAKTSQFSPFDSLHLPDAAASVGAPRAVASAGVAGTATGTSGLTGPTPTPWPSKNSCPCSPAGLAHYPCAARAPGQGTHPHDQLGEMERLHQVVVGAEAEPVHPFFGRGRAAQHENHRTFAGGADHLAERVTRYAWQASVQYDHVVAVDAELARPPQYRRRPRRRLCPGRRGPWPPGRREAGSPPLPGPST